MGKDISPPLSGLGFPVIPMGSRTPVISSYLKYREFSNVPGGILAMGDAKMTQQFEV